MPLDGASPIVMPTDTVSGEQQNVIRPKQTVVDGCPVLPKIQCHEVQMGQDARLLWNFKNPQGELIDLRTQRNLTEERVAKINKIDFAALPLKDAIVWKNGNGKRRIAVFADPNCGYCKVFEKTLQDVKDITVYTFLIPILGGDSAEKARAIWCAKEVTNTWTGWMVADKPIAKIAGACDDSALERNLAMARRYRVNGTPAVIFEDGNRAPGALPAEQLEKRLLSAAKS